MKRIRGKIVQGQHVLFANLEVWVHIETPDSWRGDFALPQDQHITVQTFRLIAQDGREGEIVIRKISPSDHGDTLINFQGQGLFEKPSN
jgi:hypothetical protein